MHQNPVMDVWTSQINCQRSPFSAIHTSVNTVCVSVCVCPALTQFTQLGNYILQMAASQGEGAKVTGGKYYCSTDLCLKVFWVSVLRPWPRRTSSASSKSPLTSAHTMMTESLLTVSASEITAPNNNKSFPHPAPTTGQDPEVSIWGDVRAHRVFSKSTNPSGISLRPRSSAEHPSTNAHQSESSEGNARKVYFKTQRGFTLLPDREERGELAAGAWSQPPTGRDASLKSATSFRIGHGRKGGDARVRRGRALMLLAWHWFNGIVSHGVERRSRQALGKVDSLFLNTSQVRTSVDRLSRPGADASRSCVLRVDQASSCFPAFTGSSWGAGLRQRRWTGGPAGAVRLGFKVSGRFRCLNILVLYEWRLC